MKLAFYLVFTFVSVQSQAAELKCSDVRLDVRGGSMEHVPTTNQGPIGICYAHGATQLFDAVRFSKGDKDYDFQTSAIEAAIGAYKANLKLGKYYGGSSRNNFESGLTCDAFNAILRQGACNGEMTDYLSENGLLGKYFFNDYNIRIGEARRPMVTKEGLSLPPSDERFSEFISRSCDSRSRKFLTTGTCKTVAYSTVATSQEKREYLDALLKYKTDLPIPITFCARFLQGHGGPDNDTRTGLCGNHVALIIGRRAIKGRCQYLLRNSWGTNNCESYAPRHREGCRTNGNIWITAGKLVRRINGITTLVQPDVLNAGEHKDH